MRLTPDQLSAAGSFIARNWGDEGYTVENITFPYERTFRNPVAIFHVSARDGSRFTVAVDIWGNARQLPQDMAASIDAVREMYQSAVTP